VLRHPGPTGKLRNDLPAFLPKRIQALFCAVLIGFVISLIKPLPFMVPELDEQLIFPFLHAEQPSIFMLISLSQSKSKRLYSLFTACL
jgi:hypothetical protein